MRMDSFPGFLEISTFVSTLLVSPAWNISVVLDRTFIRYSKASNNAGEDGCFGEEWLILMMLHRSCSSVSLSDSQRLVSERHLSSKNESIFWAILDHTWLWTMINWEQFWQWLITLCKTQATHLMKTATLTSSLLPSLQLIGCPRVLNRQVSDSFVRDYFQHGVLHIGMENETSNKCKI